MGGATPAMVAGALFDAGGLKCQEQAHGNFSSCRS